MVESYLRLMLFESVYVAVGCRISRLICLTSLDQSTTSALKLFGYAKMQDSTALSGCA